MNTKIFEDEQTTCGELYEKHGGCAWGKCELCGVPLLLEKLRTGKIYDKPEEIDKIRTKFFKPKE